MEILLAWGMIAVMMGLWLLAFEIATIFEKRKNRRTKRGARGGPISMP